MKQLLIRIWHWLRGSHTCKCGHRFNPDHYMAGSFVEEPRGTVRCTRCPCRTSKVVRACACPAGRR